MGVTKSFSEKISFEKAKAEKPCRLGQDKGASVFNESA